MNYKLILLIIIVNTILNNNSKFRKYYKIIDKNPAFTQGLILIDNNVIESSGLYGKSYLVKYNLNNSLKIEKKIDFPKNIFLEGITFFDNKILALTWKENLAYLISYPDLKIIKELENFNLNFDSKQAWGCTFDYNNNQIIVSDGTNKLYFLYTRKFNIIKTIIIPYNYLNELEYINGYLLANVWYKNFILKINLENLNIKKIHVPKNEKGVLNGIAYNKKNNSILITGKNWNYFIYLNY